MKKLTQILLFVLLLLLTLCVNPRSLNAACNASGSELMVTVTCPDSGPFFIQCFSTTLPGGYPPIAASHLDQTTSPLDISDFIAIDGTSNITGTPVGDIIIMAFDLDDTANGFIGCPGSTINVTRRYEIYDDIDGNGPDPTEMVALCLINFLITDTTPPTFTVPADMTISTDAMCSFDASTAQTGDVTDEEDNCSMNLNATFVDDNSGLTQCSGTGVIIRTWSLQDDCGNVAADQDQQITIIDNTPPVPMCVNISTELDADGSVTIDPMDLNSGSTDNCDMGLTFNIMGGNTLFCNSTQSNPNMLTLIVSDACGNTSTCIAQVTVLDNIDPVLECPDDIMTDCLENEPPYTTLMELINAGGTYMDNCLEDPNSFMLMDEDISGTCPDPVIYTRTYIVSDIAGNTATCMHTVTVDDNTGPTITCPDPILGLDCDDTVPPAATTEAEFLALTGAGLSDNCVGPISISSIDVPDASTVMFDPAGTVNIIRTYTATDICGNTNTCEQLIQYQDIESPSIVCNDPIIVALGGAGIGELNVLAVFSSVDDNCDPDPQVSIVRMGTSPGSCNDPNNFTAGNDVGFCCADLIPGSETRVVVTVTDAAGNTNSCMRTVIVQDNISPIISPNIASNCLPDITINCEFPLDTMDLSGFGSIVFDIADVEDIIVDGVTVGQDALATDNCPDGLMVSESISNYETLVCNQGTFMRNFVVTDSQGNTSTCTQSITIMDDDLFDDSDIAWPADFELDDCMNVNADTTITGRPEYDFGRCTMLAESFKDKVFPTALNGCSIIQRDWEVLDWCQHIPNADPPVGIFTHTQYITVVNSVAPTFSITCADTTICANELTCNGDLDLTASATDDCTDASDLNWSYSFDLFGAGSTVFNGLGNNLKGSYPLGDHILTWIVEDRCGNINTCDYIVTIQDCKEPNVICYNGLSAGLVNMNAGAMVMISIDRFIKEASDNCSLESELTYSFASDVIRADTIFDCCMLGQREIEIFVSDAAGNQGYCSTYIDIQDNDNICPICDPTAMAMVQGKLTNEKGEGLSSVEVNIKGVAIDNSQMTGNEGGFSFPNMEMYQEYNIKPQNDNYHLDGITTLDLVIIQKHILGISTLDSPYKVIAADINNSESITALDLLELRKLILGVTEEFSNNESWRFVDKNFTFGNATHPWPFDEDMTLQDLDNDYMHADFIGVKVGDVNLSLNNVKATNKPTSKSSFDGINLKVANHKLQEGEVVKIALLAEDFNDIVGFQMELAYNIDLLDYRGVLAGAININGENLRVNRDGSLLISWNDHIAQDVKTGDKLLELIFYVKEKGSTENAFAILEKGLKAESYNSLLERGAIEMSLGESTNQHFVVGQNIPNPFKSETIIPFTLPSDALVSLIIFDQAGKLIHTRKQRFTKGENQWAINKKDLKLNAGVLYYKIKAGSDTDTKKMIIVE